MKEMFEIIHQSGEVRTGKNYKSVRAAKMAATKMGWVGYRISNGYGILYTHNPETSQAAAAMGRAKTEKKAKSSRENGKKGGRPKQYEIITVYGDNGESETFSCSDFGKTAMTKKEWTEILKEKFSGDLTICFGTES